MQQWLWGYWEDLDIGTARLPLIQITETRRWSSWLHMESIKYQSFTKKIYFDPTAQQLKVTLGLCFHFSEAWYILLQDGGLRCTGCCAMLAQQSSLSYFLSWGASCSAFRTPSWTQGTAWYSQAGSPKTTVPPKSTSFNLGNQDCPAQGGSVYPPCHLLSVHTWPMGYEGTFKEGMFLLLPSVPFLPV